MDPTLDSHWVMSCVALDSAPTRALECVSRAQITAGINTPLQNLMFLCLDRTQRLIVLFDDEQEDDALCCSQLDWLDLVASIREIVSDRRGLGPNRSACPLIWTFFV